MKIRYNNLTQSDTVVLEVNFTLHVAFVVSNIIQVWYHWDISIESEMLILGPNSIFKDLIWNRWSFPYNNRKLRGYLGIERGNIFLL